MASVNVAKFTTSGARGLSVHFDTQKRVELEHENPHINKDLTEQNYFIGARSYNEVLYKLKERQVELDKLKPPKRLKADRITCLSVEIPIPKQLTDNGQADAFMRDAYEVLERTFGSANVQGMTVHKDEIHDYIDPKTKDVRTSLEHGHAFVTPEDPERGLNAKACLNRQKLRNLQRSMNDMCLERYGFEYNTHEVARNLSVEELKTQSLRTEQEVLETKLSMGHEKLHAQKEKFTHNKEIISKQKETIKSQGVKIQKRTKQLEQVDIISNDVKTIADKKIWSADDKAYMVELAKHGERNSYLIDKVDDLKADKKSLSAELDKSIKGLKSAQDKVYTLEHENYTLKAENAKMSQKLTKLEDFIQSQGLELPKPEIKKSLHFSR